MMQRVDHDELHKQVPLVPLLGHNTLMVVDRLFKPTNNTLTDIDCLCVSIDKASATKHPIERGLAELAISAIIQERQFLKENGYV